MVNFKMIEKPFVLLFLLCLLPLGVSAQSIVKGIVTDPSGEPVIGATVKMVASWVLLPTWMVSLALMLHLVQH